MNNDTEFSLEHYNETLPESHPEASVPSYPNVIPVSPANDQLEDNKHDETTPPPPYCSINPANDVQVITRTRNELQTSHSLYRDPPPSYHSLFKDVEASSSDPIPSQRSQVETDSSDPVTSQGRMRQKMTRSFTKAVGLGFICPVFGLFLPIIMISVGMVYREGCPVEPKLPVFLIVGGVLQMVECGWTIFNHTYESRTRSQRKRRDPWLVLIIVWIFLGSLWVYTTIPVFKKENVDRYCDPLLFRFTLWLITSYYIVLGLIFLFVFVSISYQFCITLMDTTPANLEN